MKVYSWKTLLVTVFGAGGMLVYAGVRMYRGDWLFGAALAVIALGMAVEGLEASLTEEGYRKDVETGARGKRAYRALFGKLAPVMPHGAVILMGAGAASALALPELPWAALAFVLGALAYQLWLARALRRELDREEEEEEAAE